MQDDPASPEVAKPVDPKWSGPGAIAHALGGLDLDAVDASARDIVRRKLKSKRPRAVQVLGYVQGLRRAGIKPSELMMSRVPVIPPQFRPYTVAGDVFIPGDANELYRDLLNVTGVHGKLQAALGPEGSASNHLHVYDAMKAVYGFGDPTSPKTRERGVSGFLRKVTGSTAKFGFSQRKLLSKHQDFVGRGVIGVNPELGLDEIGIPEEMAWKLYAPYVQRRLVRGGMTPGEAVKHIGDKHPLARKQLELESQERPVVYSRAPAWHKFNVIGGWPKILKDSKTIMINPLVTTGLGADFDGNCLIGSTSVIIELDRREPMYEKFGMKLSSQAKLLVRSATHLVVELPIKDIPHLAETQRFDRNGASVYDVPPGMMVMSTFPDGKGVRWETVTGFTEEHGCELKKVTTKRGRIVTCSANESL